MGKVLGAVGGVVGNAIAPGIGGIVGGAIGDVAGGAISASSTNKAADQQQAAADKAAELQKYMYDTTRADLKPFRDTGVSANNRLSYLMGIGGIDRDSIASGLKSKIPSIFNTAAPVAPAVQAPAQTAQVQSDNYRLRSLGLAGDPMLPKGNKFSATYYAPEPDPNAPPANMSQFTPTQLSKLLSMIGEK